MDPEYEEWNCNMRREMQEIIPGLFLGPLACTKLEMLVEAGITHIVCVQHEKEVSFMQPSFPEKFKFIVINLKDRDSIMIPIFSKVKVFVDNALKDGGKVLVYGNTGTCVSASLVIAYVMETNHMSHADAHALVLKKRQCIGPNETCLRQLKEYEPIFKAVRAHLNGHTSEMTGRQKRQFDEVEENISLISKMDIC
ncbi:hypothetical protein TNIN_184221 [Trichonephila inaurata madagascariensis]|uniref:Tyrosine-protein phosphatase domain-containing protein n=1 Tax=Trichonephila inaurata madagascariensis TaxID=2747483 RepID=A0A8X6K032_9ARAC|nr:hypothetical protein TNIN_184221 [Trichonephila inaurata madagascariensis]